MRREDVAATMTRWTTRRELRAADPDLADRMVAPMGSPAMLSQLPDDVLGRAGGGRRAGLRVAGN